MSELKTNKISTNDQNNVAIDNALGLKSYTTSLRDGLTSVAGDMIYNSDDAKVQVYTGSAWENVGTPATLDVDFLVVGGGGSSHDSLGTGGGGSGGVISTVDNNGGGSSLESPYTMNIDEDYTVTIGGGGAINSRAGTCTNFGKFVAFAGGSGASQSRGAYPGGGGARFSGAGTTYPTYADTFGETSNAFIEMTGGSTKQNFRGAGGDYNYGRAAGGGAGEVGNTDGGGEGGDGIICNILTTTQATAASVGEVVSTDVYYGGGGGGGSYYSGTDHNNNGGLGGGGKGAINTTTNGVAGTANTGGGGGGNGQSGNPGAGGSGVVIIKYPDTYTITVGAGLVVHTPTSPPTGYTLKVFTGGTGTISFS